MQLSHYLLVTCPFLSQQDDHGTPECSFVQYRTCKRRVLRAATLPRLVDWLVTANAEGDLDYMSSFLATYQAFATPVQVLELLLPPLGPDKTPAPRTPSGVSRLHLSSGCRKVLHVLEFWLQHHPEDFWEPPKHPSLQKVLHFLYQSAPDSQACALAEELLQAHKEGEKEEHRRGTAEAVGKKYPGEKSPRMGLSRVIREATGAGSYEEALALLSFPVDEVAEQLTLIDADLFRAVRPFHCLGCVWSQRVKKENQHVSPSVRATVAQFNAVTSCVIASVLGDLTLRTAQRAHLLEKWIAIAQRCRALRNFSSLHAILSALQSNSIYRLKRTWAAVNSSIFRKLSQIFSEDNNHLNCREILLQVKKKELYKELAQSRHSVPGLLKHTCSLLAPTIPYLGTFLTDLIMLDTALPDFVEGNLINFEKRRKEGAILSQIQQLQESCKGYNICPNPSFHVAFHHQQQLSEEQSYRISRVIEPPADSCPSSPKLYRSLTKRFSSIIWEGCANWVGGQTGNGCCKHVEVITHNLSPASFCPPSPVKNLPVSQPRTRPPVALPLPSSTSTERGTESRIIRVSMNSEHGSGNCYRSIVITSQDRTTAVVQRALQKHNLEGDSPQSYQLLQLLGDGRSNGVIAKLLIPDNANAFYAMKPTDLHDFLLCPKKGGTSSPAFPSHGST
uniref:Ral guanine nucleotide dissociation stimulator like 3 n=1 Tax=Varanus komodoensis TaxID=61221 RepID=A0A8D2LFW2_VARKO